MDARVPVMLPVLDRLKPEGNVDPEARFQDTVPLPFVDWRLARKAAPCTAGGKIGKFVIAKELAATAVPERVTPVGGKLLVVTTRVPLNDPAVDGVNVTGRVSEAPAFTT